MESHFSALQINNTSFNDSKDKSLNMILKHYALPKSETTGLSKSSSRSPLSHHKDLLNESNLPQSPSGKENVEIPELSFHKNRIIKQEMFYERIIRKFKEKQAAIESDNTIKKQKSPEDIFKEKLDLMKKELEKIEPSKKKEIFPGYNKEIQDSIIRLMSGPQNEYIMKGKNIKKSDLKTVYSPTAWLNDEVINHYLNMIVERDPNSLHTFDTFFYSKLS
jgi:Ulp1 family protease